MTSDGVVGSDWGKLIFVTCVEKWVKIVIVRGKSVSCFIGCVVGNLWRLNFWVKSCLVLSVGRDMREELGLMIKGVRGSF